MSRFAPSQVFILFFGVFICFDTFPSCWYPLCDCLSSGDVKSITQKINCGSIAMLLLWSAKFQAERFHALTAEHPASQEMGNPCMMPRFSCLPSQLLCLFAPDCYGATAHFPHWWHIKRYPAFYVPHFANVVSSWPLKLFAEGNLGRRKKYLH